MDSKNKTLTLLLVALFLISLAIFQPLTVKAQPKTLTVPDQYPTIQEALGHANAGDTVYVKKGNYNIGSNFIIGFPISLVGESSENTMLNGGNNDPTNPNNRVNIIIKAPDVTISGFTITNCETAIKLEKNHQEVPPSNCRVIGNNISDNYWAILVQSATNFQISNNRISNNSAMGIEIESFNPKSPPTGVISDNSISNNGVGINLYSKNVIVKNNTITANEDGLNLYWTGPYSIIGNRIVKNTFQGIFFGAYVNDAIVHSNEISGNIVGVKLMNYAPATGTSTPALGSGNTVYKNNFLDNQRNVVVEHSVGYNALPIDNGTDIVSWDNGKVGNYWSDYHGRDAYAIDENNIDHYPLSQPVDISESVSTISISKLLMMGVITVVAIVIVIIPVLLYRRHRKTAYLKQ
jgi:parallel beta-helix repeat protein